MCVIMAAKGYPGSYEKKTPIHGVGTLENTRTQKVFHAGTVLDGDQWLSNGGRVLAVTTLGETLEMSKVRTYDMISRINWNDGFYRKDIGWRALQK